MLGVAAYDGAGYVNVTDSPREDTATVTAVSLTALEALLLLVNAAAVENPIRAGETV